MSRLEREKQKVPIPIIVLGLLASILLIGSSLLYFIYPFPSKEKVEYTTKKNPIIFEGTIYPDEAIIENDVVYFPSTFIKEHIDDGITIDQKSNSLILTTQDKVFQMPSNSLTYFVNEETTRLEFPIYLSKNDTHYVSLDTFQALYQLKINYQKETGIITIDKDGDVILSGTIKKEQEEHDIRLRTKADLTSPYIEEVKAEDVIRIEKEEEDFYYIRKQNGVAGYVKKSVIKLQKPTTVSIATDQGPKIFKTVEWPINLTWEAVYTKNPDTTKLPDMSGLNVVSPTWFKLSNNEGDIANLGSTEYINWAKSKNYQVWGLFSNDFDPDKTHEAFKDFETRMKMIRQLLEYSQLYGLNGINLDIENVYVEDGPLVTQFVREATPYFHRAGLVVSMDITFISDSGQWSKFYEREKLADIVDYMIVMAYDEHWGTSPKSGSVASLPWVEENLQRLLEDVPNDRLILGVPLYSRIWKETDTEGGNVEVSSKAHSMEDIQAWITERNLQPVYEEASGQNYVEYRDEAEKSTYKIWIEDELSLNKRAQLVHKYQLAGVASWSRFFADEGAWSVIDQSLKKIDTTKK